MKNFRQEVYSKITGISEGWTFPSKLLTIYLNRNEFSRVLFVKTVAKDLIKADEKYARNKTPHRYELSDIEAQRICDAIENKEGFVKSTACYDSLKDEDTRWT